MLDSTKDLRDEHEAIKSGLEALKAIGKGLEEGSKEAAADGEKMIRFFSLFGDRCHHAKEERFFFPAVEKFRLPFDQDKIDLLVEDHETGRTYIKSMKEDLENIRGGDKKAATDFRSQAEAYAQMLLDHIDTEEELFVHMDAAGSSKDDHHIVFNFEKLEKQEIGDGIHEEFHSLLEEMQRNYGL